MVNHSSILAWRSPWTEEPGGLQPIGLQRVGDTHIYTHTHTHTHTHIYVHTHIHVCVFFLKTECTERKGEREDEKVKYSSGVCIICHPSEDTIGNEL